MLHNSREKYFEWTLLLLIFTLGYTIVVQALDFLGGILGAITLYVMLRHINFSLTDKYGKNKAAWIITLTITLFVLIPLTLLPLFAYDYIQKFNFDVNTIIDKFVKTLHYIKNEFNIDLMSDKSKEYITAKMTLIFNMLLSGLNNFAVNLFTAILVLFFLLAGGRNMEHYISRLLPFNEKNKDIIKKQIYLTVRSNAIGIPLLALIQGIIAGIGYYIFGVNNAILFAILTGFASIIPLVGTMIIWIPLCIAQYFEGSLYQTIGLLAYCTLVVAQCDNVIRLFLQKKMADTHPLITIFGVIVGLPVFGFMGVIFGPLLVGMFLLILDMFAKQYVLGEIDDNNNKNIKPNLDLERKLLTHSDKDKKDIEI